MMDPDVDDLADVGEPTDPDEVMRQKRFAFIAAVLVLVVLGVMVAAVLWHSYAEWGSLPSTAGNGAILYGGIVLALLATAAHIVWSWEQSREARRE